MSTQSPAAPTPRLSARARRRGTVIGYDFSSPARLSRDHTRLLEIAFETFGRQWATQLGSRLRCESSVSLLSVAQHTYDAYVAGITVPSAMVLFTLDTGSAATGVLQLPATAALRHLDHALGGPGGSQPERALTEIETTVTRAMCERVLATLGYAFTPVGPLAPKVEAFHQDSQLLQAARATEMVIVATFSLQLGAVGEPVSLMLPLQALQARLAASAPQEVQTAEELERAAESDRTLHATLPEVPVDVTFRMSPLPMSPDGVLGLAVGDLLRLPHPIGRPLDVAAADVVVARAVPTSRGNRRACLIVSHQEDPR